MTDSSTVAATCQAINAACRSQGGVYAGYSCKSVSWEDAERGTLAAATLSCWGGNITDVRLWEKSGVPLYTCRTDNWNEKLGKVDAHQIAMVVGNHLRPSENQEGVLRTVTLADFLKQMGSYGAYAGVDGATDLHDKELDKEISIRFQTTFLPVNNERASTLEFCTEAYNYNTMRDDDPRNVVLLCTTQGVAVQQDGAGAQKLFHHSVDNAGVVHRHWLEAERSQHEVGGAQTESAEEAQAAAARGKATASVIGIEAMGTRFNVLMTIQVPLEQKPRPVRAHGYYGGGYDDGSGDLFYSAPSRDLFYSALTTTKKKSKWAPPGGRGGGRGGGGGRGVGIFATRSRSSPPPRGVANAARVSRGSNVDGRAWKGVCHKTPKRDANQHVTVTVVLYYTVAGGVPSMEDVKAAVDDMEQLYAACGWTGRLAEEGANFMKSELTVAEAADIAKKVSTQPYQPQGMMVENASVFPTSQTSQG